jgi:cystathionine gamma-lyase
VLKLFKAGDHIVCGENVYGGSHRLMERIYGNLGLKVSFVDMRDVGNIERALTPSTRMIYCETPTNPMMNLTDLTAVGDLTQAHGYLCVVDNTFATPFFQRPLEFGADIVLHSTTKYLNGHSDMVGGVAVVGENKELADQMQFLQNAVGAIAGPFDSFLAMRGLKTLALRMERHSENALEIARWLATEKKIAKIFYPGLENNPYHELAKQQMRGFGGMVTVVLDTDLAGTRRFLENTHLFSLAESLGGVESLINHPALMTHGSIPPEMRTQLGITDSLVRLSVGVEDLEDLKDDLRTALAAI